jgi:hypothetical protein
VPELDVYDVYELLAKLKLFAVQLLPCGEKSKPSVVVLVVLVNGK